MPERVQRQRTRGWRMPDGAVYVGRGSRWGNPFAYRTDRGLARVPAAVGDGPWEYEGRISADGARHDYHHADSRITVCHVRYMTRAEVVETYRRALLDDPTPAMRMSSGRFLRVTLDDVRRELAGKNLACWCHPGDPCHSDVLLELANAPECSHCGGALVACGWSCAWPICKGWNHAALLSMGPVGPHYCEGRSIMPSGEPATQETEEP